MRIWAVRPAMTRSAAKAFLAGALLLLTACAGNAQGTTTTAATTSSTGSTSTTSTTAPTSTTASSTTTSSTTTTQPTSTTTLPGEPIDLFAKEGDVLAVVGVAFDDVLNVRAAPGADQPILAKLDSLEDNVIATGRARQLSRSIWYEVTAQGVKGWANIRFLAFIGGTDDTTASLVSQLGGTPAARTMLELGMLVARAGASEDPPSDIVMSAAPTVGDLGKVTYDVIGLGDDAVYGVRLRVFGQPTAEGFSLKAVEATLLCGRGVTDEGLCP